ncbi:MAG: dependent ligase [Polaromonas sp.]|jgi:DNA ligase-1|nr:dependent ligase [Polaromonas sp.]
MRRRLFLSLTSLPVAVWALPAATASANPLSASSAPALMLANVYRDDLPLADYWVSEKYDGVRGYWNGQALWTRGGERIAAPAWFTAGWPKEPLDGELWAGHGRFARAVSTVRHHTPNDAAWRTLRFMVFDLPEHGGTFTERIPALHGVVSRIDLPWVQAVAQSKVASSQALQALLDKTVKNGGEGLMLHRGASAYRGVRSDDLLKLKKHDDSDALVVAHIPGQGRHTGRMGALLVEMPPDAGKPAQRFKLGTGFSDAQRISPPAIGSRVTYRFMGLNDSGLPRFASFMRVRGD